MAASCPCDAASDAAHRVESARRAANAEASRYMTALRRTFERLRSQAAGVETVITEGEQRVESLRRIVQRRARARTSVPGQACRSLLTVSDLPDLMRSDKLLTTANVTDDDVLSVLNAQQEDLKVQREDLRHLQDQQGSALGELQRELSGRRAARRGVAVQPGGPGPAAARPRRTAETQRARTVGRSTTPIASCLGRTTQLRGWIHRERWVPRVRPSP